MKKIKKSLCVILAAFLLIFPTLANTATVEAAPSAKSLVSSALSYMKGYKSIAFNYDRSRKVDGKLKRRAGMVMSTVSVQHGFYLDSSQSEGGWEEYSKKNTFYRKGYNDTSWTSYSSTGNVISKNDIEYTLKNLKDIKITAISTTSYKLTAKPSVKSNVKTLVLVINKSKKCLSSCALYYKTYTDTYLSSNNAFTIENQVTKYKNISYCTEGISLPSGL